MTTAAFVLLATAAILTGALLGKQGGWGVMALGVLALIVGLTPLLR